MTRIQGDAPRVQQSATSPQPSGPGQTSGALGLGVEVGVLSEATIGEAFLPAADKPVDKLENKPRAEPTDRPRQAPEESKDLRRAANPFRALPRGETPAPNRTLAKAVPVDKEIDLPLASLGKLAEAESKLWPAHQKAFAKIRQGNLLVTHDGQSARANVVAMDSGELQTSAAKLVKDAHNKEATKEHIEQLAKLQAKLLSGAKMDIHSFVQRVLRECYQIQNEMLGDRAAKVEFQNEQKRKLRARAKEGRETLTQWRTAEKGNASFIAEEPFDCLELDEDGEWRQPKMDEADVQAWRDAVRNALDAREGGGDVSTSYGAFFSDESRLSADDKWLMQRALGNPDADWIEQHIGEVVAVVSVMNKEEVEEYVLAPGSENLLHSLVTRDMESITFFLANMSPVQALYMMANPVLPDPLNVPHQALGADGAVAGASVAGGAVGASFAAQGAAAGSFLGPLGSLFGAIIGGIVGTAAGAGVGVGVGVGFIEACDWFNGLNSDQQDQFERSLSQIFENAAAETGFEWDHELTQENAAELLDRLDDQFTSGESSFGSPPEVGDAKSFNVPSQLETYIKGLEDQLSQVGDDAQLANVDLQNTLQQQQQTLQMMSNIAKMLHDTALATVRKLGQ